MVEDRGKEEVRPRQSVGKLEGRRSGGQRIERGKRERLVGAQEMVIGGRLTSDRPAASDRVTRGLGIVAHRWSISIAGSYRALRAL